MFEFEWDPAKAARNLRKHQVSFQLAATVFQDQFMRSIPDEDHSDQEDRWITMGIARNGQLLAVSQTEASTDGDTTSVRIISARPASPKERRQDESGE